MAAAGSALTVRPGSLFWRALAAFLVLPGTIGFLVPWMLRPRADEWHFEGLVPLVGGALLLFWCVRDFYVAGQGTLAPWAPPRELVTVGLYRISRNPMYLAVLVILAGWATLFRSPTLWGYAAAVTIAFHLRVILGEEPWLAKRFGKEWMEYRSRVPRWLL